MINAFIYIKKESIHTQTTQPPNQSTTKPASAEKREKCQQTLLVNSTI